MWCEGAVCVRERSAERECCLLALNLVSSTPPYPSAGAACSVLGVCGRVYVCTQAFIGFLGFELLVNNASSGTLAFSLRLVPFLPAAAVQIWRFFCALAVPSECFCKNNKRTIIRRRSPRESREGLRQVGRAQGEVMMLSFICSCRNKI